MGNFLRNCIAAIDKKNPTEIESTKSKNAQQNQPSQQDMTILKLKNAQDRLLAQKKAIQKNADKAYEEAKQHIANKNKERAMFALKRRKLYETYLRDTENQYAILQKSILDVESAIMTSNYLEVLKSANDLIKEIDVAKQMETIQEIGMDIKERENQTKEFNRLFEEHHIDDVDDLYNQFAQEIFEEDVNKINNEPLKADKQANIISEESQVEVRKEEQQEEQEEDEVSKQLQQLA